VDTDELHSLSFTPLAVHCPLTGLDDRPAGEIKEEDIKVAFRTAAMEWHPDKQVRPVCVALSCLLCLLGKLSGGGC
jgi:hypothetical protein